MFEEKEIQENQKGNFEQVNLAQILAVSMVVSLVFLVKSGALDSLKNIMKGAEKND